jgi:hypothetical protein
MQHGQHLCLPPSNDGGEYNNEDIPVIPASDLGEAADHFLTMAIIWSAFSSSSLSSLSRAVAAAAGQRGNGRFVAVSIANDDNGVEENVNDNNVMTRIQATARTPSPSPPT